MLLLERGTLGSGTSAQSSCIVRTHYSVPINVALAQAALGIFEDFQAYLDDAEADVSGAINKGSLRSTRTAFSPASQPVATDST